MLGALGALVILLFVFGTLPAVLMPLVVAMASILNTFTLVWILTYITNVSIIVQFLIALVGLGVAIDYALLMIFRFRDELREGAEVEPALVETMAHAGRSVIVSGSTVAVGLLSLVVIPLPFIRSMGIGGMLIPLVSVITAITLLPGAAGNGRYADQQLAGDAEAVRRPWPPRDGRWGWWARLVLRHPWPVALSGLAVVAVLVFYGLQLNPNEAQLKNFPGTGTAIAGREMLADANISPGAMKPLSFSSRTAATPTRSRPRYAPFPGSSAQPRRPRGGAAATRSSRRSRPSTAPHPESRPSSTTRTPHSRAPTAHSAASRRSTETSFTPSTATSRTCSRSCSSSR